MARVLIDLRRPEKTGPVAASGRLEWRPTARRTQDAFVVLPAVFDVQLVGGVASVEVAPSEPGWVWRVSEYVAGGATRFVAVPDVPEVAYADLVDVDPATLEPTAAPDPAWYAYTDGLALSAEAARTAAVAAQATAVAAADDAEQSAASAEAARQAAESAETDAGAAASVAATAAAAAQVDANRAAAEAVVAKVAAQQSAASSEAAQLFVEHLAVTANPDDPDAVTLHFPSWRYAPGDTDAIQLTIGVDA